MEYLARLPEQLAARFRTLSVQHRTAAVLFCLAILVGALFFANGAGDEPYEALFGGRTFSNQELAEMTAAFHKADLSDSRTVANQIHVPQTEKAAYLVALQSSDALPPDIDESVDEAVANSRFFATAQETEMSYRHAEQKKLARIVASLDGIETASVRYDEFKKPGFPPSLEVRALVAVRAIGGRELDFEQIEAIRDTVTGYVAGLDRAHVTVTDLVARRAYPGSYDRDGALNASYGYLSAKRIMESEFRAKIQRWLEMYPGVVVGVDVHLTPLAPSSQSADGNHGQPEDPLVPSRVTASIGLPKSYPAQIWRDRTGSSGRSVSEPGDLNRIEQEIREDVQRAVLALLPSPQTDTQGQTQVTVTFYEGTQTLAATQPEVNSTTSTWMAEHKVTAALGLVVLVGCAVFFGWKYRAARLGPPRRATAAGVTALPLDGDGQVISEIVGSQHLTQDMQDAVKDIVRQDPEAAAELIRRWLEDAA